MSKTLLLMRHAQAGHAIGIKDIERPLTPEGERDARHMGIWLHGQNEKVEAMVVSTALRASTTAQIVSEQLGISKIINSEELYEPSIRTMLEIIQKQNDLVQTLMIVGHNPAITYLAEYLTGKGFAGMEPGSIYQASFELEAWSDLGQATGKFLSYTSPRDV